MKVVDLRSDTVTWPTGEMIKAMQNAEVGDDGYGEDPTVRKLEELAADMVGKEAALFTPTGVMGNQVAIFTHTRRGDEIVAEANAHVVTSERGAPAIFSSVLVRTVTGEMGVLNPEDVQSVIRKPGSVPRTSLLCIENTHNKAGGTVTSLNRMKELCRLAHANELAVHVDGARIFNAGIALGVKPRELLAEADSAMFCLSKGLCAPVGSILTGTSEFIARARQNRYLLGGQMRQIGMLAAAGIVALTKMVDRMAEDHEKARKLALGLKEIKGIDLDLERVQTNIVIFDIGPLQVEASRFLSLLKEENVKAFPFTDRIIRMVPHFYISEKEIDQAILAVQKVVKKITAK
jgi:threonine aldolase